MVLKCEKISFKGQWNASGHLQVERLIVFGRPVVRLGLGRHLALLVLQIGSDQVDLDERPEHARLDLPLQVVGGHHCK